MGQSPTELDLRPSPARRSCALETLLEEPGDLARLERMLAAVAVHPGGADFQRVQLLYWEPLGERLCPRLRAVAQPAGSLSEAIERARRDSPPGLELEGDPGGGFAIAPAALEGPARVAWERGEIAVGAGGDAPSRWCDGAQVGAVPLRRGGKTWGLWVGEWAAAGDETARRETLGGFARMVDEALAAQDREAERQRSARRAAAVAELARAAVSPCNLAEVLHLTARLAAEATGARGSALWRGGAQLPPRLDVAYGAAGERERWARALEPLAAAVMTSGKPRVSERPADEFLLSAAVAAELAAVAAFPMLAYGRVCGAIVVYDRVRSHPAESAWFDRADREFFAVVADLAAMAIDHAGRFLEVQLAEQRNRELRARLGREEWQAARSRWAGRLAEEARRPVASVQTFARRALEEFAADDPRREYLEVVLREAERLERMVGEPLADAAWEPPSLRLDSLNEVVQEVLQGFGELLVRRRVRLVKKLSPELPSLLLDRDRVRQVLTRIIGGALEVAAVGGRMRVESRRAPQHVIVEVAHDGLTRSGGALEQLFVPLSPGRIGGGGVGLAVAQRIVREHGGEIRVRAEGESSTVVSFTIPIRDNQDRRHAGPDRRRSLGDRRERWPGL